MFQQNKVVVRETERKGERKKEDTKKERKYERKTIRLHHKRSSILTQ